MRPQSGFSLLELAIAIVILAAILGSVMVPVATQVQARKIKETEQLLQEVKDALLGFALVHGRLPCPDDPATGGITGTEDRPLGPPLGACNAFEGFLPWNAVGVSPTDAWGRLLYYGVTPEFTQAQLSGTPCAPGDGFMGLCDIGTITVRDTTQPPPPGIFLVGGAPPTPGAPAVIVSTGPNGLGGTELSGNVVPPPAPSAADERNNLPGINVGQFVLRPYFDDAPAGCVDPACNFDDLVVWLSTPMLFNRMVAAGRLP